MSRKSRLRKRDILVISIVVLLVLAGLYLGAQWLEDKNASPEPRGDYRLRYEDKQLTVNGQTYRQRSNLITILFMGIDQEDISDSTPAYLRYLSGGQADFLRLMVIDPLEKTIAQIEIDRDTMTPITMLNTLGEKLGYRTAQICLSHSYGDGKEQSCEYTVEAVSNLLYNLPIKYYAAMNLDGISTLNDMLGGVTVTLADDFSHLDPAMTKGTTLTLVGDQAEIFVRSRMSMEVGTNEARMARQQQYVSQMMELLHQKIQESSDFIGALFDSLAPQLCTNMSRAQMMNEAWTARNYTRLPLQSISGVHQKGDYGYIQFLPDEASLEQVILDVFYQKVK
ncbi:MAG: LCP family protein [Clostridia bacterium]|nr:LCP family protein [Clostridia bacterium]